MEQGPSPSPPEAQAPERSRKHLSQDPGAWGPVPPRFQVHWPGPEVFTRAQDSRVLPATLPQVLGTAQAL